MIRRFHSRFLSATVLVAVVSLSGTGCDDTVDPFVEEDRFFTIFGFLDTATDTQMVRVEALRTEFAASGGEPIDGEIRTTAVESGEVVVWRDSVVTFEDGSAGHVYLGDFRPIPGWTYLFEVERSDGRMSSATTTIPPATNVTVEDPTVATEEVFQRIRWTEIDAEPFRVEVWYRFMNTQPSQPFLNGVVVYGDEDERVGRQVGVEEWEVLVRLTEDRDRALAGLTFSDQAAPFLMGIGMRLTMTDDQWRPPGGVFNREVLVQPGTFSNVENGFGFLGSVNQYTVEWTVSPEIVERMGFSFPE